MSVHRQPAEPQPRPAVVFVVVGPLVAADVPHLCDEAHALLHRVAIGTPVECDVGAIGTPDTVTVDALARLQLTARRLGHRVALRGASPELRAVLRRAGLCDAVPIAPTRSQRDA